jgi:hypothetical protein
MNGPIITAQETEGLRSEMLSDTTKDFSLMLGGPLYQYFLRVGLVKPPLDRVGWRMIAISMFAWAPLLLVARNQQSPRTPCPIDSREVVPVHYQNL